MSVRSYIFLLVVAASVLPAVAQDPSSATPKPTLISAPEPTYPEELRNAGIGGKVSVRVVVDEDGKVVNVDQPLGPARICNASYDDPRVVLLRRAMIDSMRQARFEAAMKDGKRVRSVAFVSSTFDPTAGDPENKRIVNLAMTLVRRAEKLPKPDYPAAARASRATGAVAVRVVVDDKGKPFTVEALSGHPLLQPAAVEVACDARFTPHTQNNAPIMMSGLIVYNFVP